MIYKAQIYITREMKGEKSSKVFPYEFSKGSAFENRKAAINKLKDYSHIFQKAQSDGTDYFHSAQEVIDGSLENHSGYSFTLNYVVDGEECEVYGICDANHPEFYELLDYECTEFLRIGIDSKEYDEILFEGNTYKVLKEDLIFLMTA
ncbi:MAG: hypothetical protein QNK23_14365 [Crocinitomicaceae bacterium]|nr:hypothetical protein [Crocinitomicaceae bacterium]